MINHIIQTFIHKFWVMIFIIKFCLKLTYRGILHDFSKFSRNERSSFAKYTPLLKDTKYGSAKYHEMLNEMRSAIDHHQMNNRHHPEYFGVDGFSGMNLIDVIELWCDWNAALRRNKKGNIMQSIKHGQDRFTYDRELFCIFVNTAFSPKTAERIIEDEWKRY